MTRTKMMSYNTYYVNLTTFVDTCKRAYNKIDRAVQAVKRCDCVRNNIERGTGAPTRRGGYFQDVPISLPHTESIHFLGHSIHSLKSRPKNIFTKISRKALTMSDLQNKTAIPECQNGLKINEVPENTGKHFYGNTRNSLTNNHSDDMVNIHDMVNMVQHSNETGSY